MIKYKYNYCKKAVSYAFYSKTKYLSGNSRAVDARLLYFTYTHSRQLQKSTVTCIEMNVI